MTARFLAARRRLTGASEAYGQSYDRSMLHHIIFVSVLTGAFFKVRAQGPVPQQARVGDAIGTSEGEAVGAKHISWQLAAGAEATHIGPEHQFLTRGQHRHQHQR